MAILVNEITGSGLLTQTCISAHNRARDRQNLICSMAKEEKGMKSLLLAAAKDADLETVMKCIKAGSPLDEKDGAGHGTALHLAARSNCPDICEFLLRNGANVNAQTTWKSTPLHVASERGHTKCVLRLLVFGADINGVNCNGETALHLAAKRGLVDMVELLIGAGAKLNVPDKDGITPLRAAKAEGREDTVAILSRTKDSIEDLRKRFQDAKTQLATEEIPKDLCSATPTGAVQVQYRPRHATRVELAWKALARLPAQWQEDIAAVFREEMEKADLGMPNKKETLLDLANSWILGHDYTIKGDVPVSTTVCNTRLVITFEVHHRQLGTKVLKVLIGLRQKGNSLSDVNVEGVPENDILGDLPPHPNIVKVVHMYVSETQSFKRFIPLVLPSHLRNTVRLARMATCLVTHKYPFTLEGLRGSLHKAGVPCIGETFLGLILIQALNGVKHLQDKGIVHGNINLENLLVDNQLRVVIADFSSATLFQETDKDMPNAFLEGTTTQAHQATTRKHQLQDVRAIAKAVESLMYQPTNEGKQVELISTSEEQQDPSTSAVEAPAGCKYSQSLVHLLTRMQSNDPTSSLDVDESIVRTGALLFFGEPVNIKNREDFRCWLTANLIDHTLCNPENICLMQNNQHITFQINGMTLDGQKTLDITKRAFLCQTPFHQLWPAYESINETESA